jgi:peptidyl-prolyl cis-trans isomerase A (cyclophilin A)
MLHRTLSSSAGIALCLALAGCGGGGGGAAGASTPGTGASDPLVTSSSAGTPKYGQGLIFTLNGSHLDAGWLASAPGCKTLTTSTTAPNVSSASTAYLRCVVGAIGNQTLQVVKTADGSTLASLAFTVPQPQVTFALSNGLAVSGNIVLTLAADKAPITVDNFLAYVNAKAYDNIIFHRLQAGFVLQGGGYAAPVAAGSSPAHISTNAPITLEVGTGLSNTQWSIAMARSGLPDTATSEFFINLVNNANLDSTGAGTGYAVFGSVTSGTTDVLPSIISAPCSATPPNLPAGSGCLPVPNVVITTAVQTR